ncbi:UNVERIFIED_CONTAM: variable surface lipoprotein [Campylobacter lari]
MKKIRKLGLIATTAGLMAFVPVMSASCDSKTNTPANTTENTNTSANTTDKTSGNSNTDSSVNNTTVSKTAVNTYTGVNISLKKVEYDNKPDLKTSPFTYDDAMDLSDLAVPGNKVNYVSSHDFTESDLVQPKKEDQKKSIFINSFKGVTKVHGKSESNRPFEGIVLGEIKNLNQSLAFTSAVKPTYKDTRANGYSEVLESSTDKEVKVLVRLFNFKAKKISSNVYELTLTVKAAQPAEGSTAGSTSTPAVSEGTSTGESSSSTGTESSGTTASSNASSGAVATPAEGSQPAASEASSTN